MVLEAVGYSEADVDDLCKGALPQRRLLDNSPLEIDHERMGMLYLDAMRYW